MRPMTTSLANVVDEIVLVDRPPVARIAEREPLLRPVLVLHHDLAVVELALYADAWVTPPPLYCRSSLAQIAAYAS